MLIASASPLACDYRLIEGFDNELRVRQDLASIGIPSMTSLLGELMLYGDSLNRALACLPELSGRPADFASTDFYPYLEYQTPKGNVLPYNTVPLNLSFMQRFRPLLLPPDLVIDNLPSQSERSLILGYVAERRGDRGAALDYFRQVDGVSQPLAELEITRIQPKAAPAVEDRKAASK